MNILVACEESGAVRDAFRARGHIAYSCDLLPSRRPSPWHWQEDIFAVLERTRGVWDMLLMFPPCTYLCSSGLHWNTRRPGRAQQTEEALGFVARLWAYPVRRKVLENPIGCLSSRWRKPDQIIQPHHFGHPESKATCLWLEGLPLLVATNILAKPASGRWDNQTASGQNKLGPSDDRALLRATTYPGIADAMAAQWG